jgi:hypothetical protein
MQRTATPMPHLAAAFAAAAAACASHWSARLGCMWAELTMDADERFLRGAHDLADLEWRLQRLQRGRAERFGPFHPDA